jgi:methionyl-tRNA formyltransferase
MVITDNEFLYNNFKLLISDEKYKPYRFDFRYSYNNSNMKFKYENHKEFTSINIKKSISECLQYDLIISVHCKQIFPKEIVDNVNCINIHPGYNPYNRGWFPQVFSIINNKPLGVTIHKMDEKLDHGEILFRENIEINEWETSYDLYEKIMKKEVELISDKLLDILIGNYNLISVEEGNVNYISDFKKMCALDLDEKLSMREAISKLRALTFNGYKNAYFMVNEEKVFVTINLEKEKS